MKRVRVFFGRIPGRQHQWPIRNDIVVFVGNELNTGALFGENQNRLLEPMGGFLMDNVLGELTGHFGLRPLLLQFVMQTGRQGGFTGTGGPKKIDDAGPTNDSIGYAHIFGVVIVGRHVVLRSHGAATIVNRRPSTP